MHPVNTVFSNDTACIHVHTHSYTGAPVVINLLLSAPEALKRPVQEAVKRSGKSFHMLTGGAPPPPSQLPKLKADLGITVQSG